jgi:ubiquinone/menaquinone biosynthesis C-methylase UbiE
MLREREVLLDVGCSDGKFVSWALPKCDRAVGADVDARTLRKARENCPEAEFLYGSADDIPLEDSSSRW